MAVPRHASPLEAAEGAPIGRNQGVFGLGSGQLALRRLLPAPDTASGYPKLRWAAAALCVFTLQPHVSQARDPCGEMGGFTRLLTSPIEKPDEYADEIPTVVVKEARSAGYVVVNRPHSMVLFLQVRDK